MCPREREAGWWAGRQPPCSGRSTWRAGIRWVFPCTGPKLSGAGIQKTVPVVFGFADVWVTENPAQHAVEEWHIYNFTADAHPIHLHLVRVEVVERTVFDMDESPPRLDVVQPWESGFEVTMVVYPGQITHVKAPFDLAGLYGWHCHIVEHEDNEMMRPYFVGD